MEKISSGIWSTIFKFLDIKDFPNLSETNKITNNIVSHKGYQIFFNDMTLMNKPFDNIAKIKHIHKNYLCACCDKFKTKRQLVTFSGDINLYFCDICIFKYCMSCEKCTKIRPRWYINYDPHAGFPWCGTDVHEYESIPAYKAKAMCRTLAGWGSCPPGIYHWDGVSVNINKLTEPGEFGLSCDPEKEAGFVLDEVRLEERNQKLDIRNIYEIIKEYVISPPNYIITLASTIIKRKCAYPDHNQS